MSSAPADRRSHSKRARKTLTFQESSENATYSCRMCGTEKCNNLRRLALYTRASQGVRPGQPSPNWASHLTEATSGPLWPPPQTIDGKEQAKVTAINYHNIAQTGVCIATTCIVQVSRLRKCSEQQLLQEGRSLPWQPATPALSYSGDWSHWVLGGFPHQ